MSFLFRIVTSYLAGDCHVITHLANQVDPLQRARKPGKGHDSLQRASQLQNQPLS